jgi:hypothetical protein
MNAQSSLLRGGLLTIVLMLAACGGPLKYSPQGTQIAAGADAEIIAHVDNKAVMSRVTINAVNLPPPDRIVEQASAFVVWARKDGGPWQRVGALTYDKDKRKGEMIDVSVPLASFELVVTAEQQGDPPGPSKSVVFNQKVAQ